MILKYIRDDQYVAYDFSSNVVKPAIGTVTLGTVQKQPEESFISTLGRIWIV